MRLPRRPMWCSPPVRACRISPPAHGRCLPIRRGASSASTCSRSMRPNISRSRCCATHGWGSRRARPEREVIVMVGDGSYLMMNSEIATSVMLGLKLIIVVLDNRGFACIDRLQRATGGESFNNLFEHARHAAMPQIDFAAHATSLGATATKVAGLSELETALKQARAADRTSVIVIDTDPLAATEAGGHWWDVAVPEG